MTSALRFRIFAAVGVLLFGLWTFRVVRGNIDALDLTMWGMAPQILALLILWRAKTRRTVLTAALLIVIFWILGYTVFFHGGPVGLFLPMDELVLLAVVFSLVGIGSALRRALLSEFR